MKSAQEPTTDSLWLSVWLYHIPIPPLTVFKDTGGRHRYTHFCHSCLSSPVFHLLVRIFQCHLTSVQRGRPVSITFCHLCSLIDLIPFLSYLTKRYPSQTSQWIALFIIIIVGGHKVEVCTVSMTSEDDISTTGNISTYITSVALTLVLTMIFFFMESIFRRHNTVSNLWGSLCYQSIFCWDVINPLFHRFIGLIGNFHS